MNPREILTTLSPLKNLPQGDLKDLLWQASFVHKRRGELLYSEGEDFDGSLLLVLEGEIEILFPSPALAEKHGPGTICGEIALVNSNGKRTATVRAASETLTLLRWNNAELRSDPNLIKVLRGVAWPRIVEQGHVAERRAAAA
jgi:CRP-like cAMP-binding protein